MGSLVRPTLDFWPHPVTAAGRALVVVEPGRTIAEIFEQVPLTGAAVATVNGTILGRERWGEVRLREGDVVTMRAAVRGAGGDGEGSNPIAIVASIALLITAPYLAGYALTGEFALVAGIEASLLTAGIGIGGMLIINQVFPPRLPTPATQANVGQPDPQYSLTAGANSARPYETILLVLGEHRVFPDIVSRPYTEYDADSDQYLNQIFDYGIGTLEFEPHHLGDTELDDFEDVETEKALLVSGAKRILGTLVAGNVDTIEGGALEYNSALERSTAVGTFKVGFDIIAQHFRATDDGNLDGRNTRFRLEWRRVGDRRMPGTQRERCHRARLTVPNARNVDAALLPI